MQAGERLVFFDLETAGLLTDASIIQIAAIAVDSSLREVESFEAKIRFDISQTSKQALDVNSFEPQVWQRLAMQPDKAAKKFSNFLRNHATVDKVSKAGNPYQVARLVAHNAAFDGPKIISWFEDMDIFLPAARNAYCTLQRAYWLFEEDKSLTPPENFKLVTLCEYFGISFCEEVAHDALADVRATAQVYRAILYHHHGITDLAAA